MCAVHDLYIYMCMIYDYENSFADKEEWGMEVWESENQMSFLMERNIARYTPRQNLVRIGVIVQIVM